MDDRPRRRHYALGLAKAKGGWKVEAAIERRSRAEANVSSLTLAARHEEALAITVDREIHHGEVLDAATLKRPR
jgi:hypothetical protein